MSGKAVNGCCDEASLSPFGLEQTLSIPLRPQGTAAFTTFQRVPSLLDFLRKSRYRFGHSR